MNYNVFKVVEVIMVIVRMVNVSVNQDGLAVYAIWDFVKISVIIMVFARNMYLL